MSIVSGSFKTESVYQKRNLISDKLKEEKEKDRISFGMKTSVKSLRQIRQKIKI